MQVYRTMSSGKLIGYINDNALYGNSIKGKNTVNYEIGISYIHFFKYLDHALYYMKQMNNPVVAKIDISNNLISNLEFGLYGGVETYYDDSLAGYYIPLPEYVMERDLFHKKNILDFSYNGVWQDPLRKKDYSSKKIFFGQKRILKKDLRK